MGILKVGSTNPKFSYVISKNPATIKESKKPFTRQVRKGVAYGWFSQNDQEFTLWFRDNAAEVSFAENGNSNFEYLDRSRYGSSYLPIALITACLNSASKNIEPDDVPGFEAYATTALTVRNDRFFHRVVEAFQNEATIQVRPVGLYSYELTVRAPLVHTVLNTLQVICLLQSLSNPGIEIRLDETALEKFLKLINVANAPYYLRYVFATKAFSSRKSFAKLRDKLQGPGMIMFFGDTRRQRFDNINQQLSGGDTLIDIGCGELFYALKLSGRYKEVFAIDADPEMAEANEGRITNRQITNVVSLNAQVDAQWVSENETLFEGADVLLTEVVEHMELEQATSLVQAILQTNFRELIITTPNKSFNKHYGMLDEQMRHYDHKWEMTSQEFLAWILKLEDPDQINAVAIVSGIGDIVDDEAITNYAHFVRRPDSEELERISTGLQTLQRLDAVND